VPDHEKAGCEGTMEHKMLCRLVQYLLEHYFPSKKERATSIAVPYRVFLKACTGHGEKDSDEKATNHILRYCIQIQIPLDQAVG